MSLEWKSCKIGDVVSVRRGASPRPIKDYISEKGMPWVKIADATKDQTRFINFTSEFIKEGGIEKSVVVNPGDLIVSNSATPGLPKFMNIKACVHDGWLVFDNYDGILKDFLYYYFIVIRGRLVNQANGSVFKNLKTDIVKDFNINLPDMETQEKIANILSQIDKKIELNININKNLEQLIKYIYINWFEDFEPFKGNTFHDTKLGKIPNGWNVKPLHEFIKFQEGPGIRNWQYVEEDGINFLNIRCIQNNDLILNTANMISKEEANGKYAHFMLNEWDLVISSSGTLGRYAIVRKEHLPLCLNTSIIRFKPLHSINHYAYVYSYLTSRGFYHYLLTMSSGSVQLNFGPTHLKQIDLIVPPEDVLKRYNETVFPIIEKIVKIKAEINKLTKLRDTLLPKLMSGEIDVSKINCDLELICKLTLFTHKYPNQLCKHKLIHLNLKSLRKSKNTAFKVDFGQFLFYN